MKQITIAGRTGKAGELRRTERGDSVLSFPVAVDDGYGDKKTTMWFDCVVWGKRAEALASHIGKGDAVTVSGDLSRREYDGKTYLTVRADQLTLQGGSDKKALAKEAKPIAREPDDPRTSSRDLDDEIPF